LVAIQFQCSWSHCPRRRHSVRVQASIRHPTDRLLRKHFALVLLLRPLSLQVLQQNEGPHVHGHGGPEIRRSGPLPGCEVKMHATQGADVPQRQICRPCFPHLALLQPLPDMHGGCDEKNQSISLACTAQTSPRSPELSAMVGVAAWMSLATFRSSALVAVSFVPHAPWLSDLLQIRAWEEELIMLVCPTVALLATLFAVLDAYEVQKPFAWRTTSLALQWACLLHQLAFGAQWQHANQGLWR